MKTIRAFIAHPKNDALDLGALKQKIAKALVAAAGTRATVAAVVTGKDHYEAHFRRCGSWDAWTRDVGAGIHPVTRDQQFNLFVVPEGPIGKATAGILQHAFAAGKPVLRWDGTTLTRAKSLVTLDAEDYKSGWRLT